MSRQVKQIIEKSRDGGRTWTLLRHQILCVQEGDVVELDAHLELNGSDITLLQPGSAMEMMTRMRIEVIA